METPPPPGSLGAEKARIQCELRVMLTTLETKPWWSRLLSWPVRRAIIKNLRALDDLQANLDAKRSTAITNYLQR